MDEILQQVAFANQLNEAWKTVNNTASFVLKSIDDVVDITISKIKKLADAISNSTVPAQQNTQVVQAYPNVASGNGKVQENISATTKNSVVSQTDEKKSTIEIAETSVKMSKDAVGMVKMVTDSVPGLEKWSNGLEKLNKALEFGEKGIDFAKKFKGLAGEGIGTSVIEDGAAAIVGGLDMAAVIESVSAIAIAAGPVGWAIGGAALVAGGAAAWYMSKKETEEKEAHKYDGDKGLNSFANEDPGKAYKPTPSPNFFTSPTKQIALIPNRSNTLAPVIDNTYNKPLPKMPLLTANAKYNQAILAGLVKLGTSKGKGDFDDFANSMISQAQGTPSLLKYVNKTVSTAGGDFGKEQY